MRDNQPPFLNRPEHPGFRATIDGDRLLVTPWTPMLQQISEAEAERIAGDGTAMADLWIGDSATGREIIVRWLAEPEDSSSCPDPLRDWAACLGYRRIWPPEGAPLELDRAEAPTAAPVRCEWCGWRPRIPELHQWGRLQSMGYFPPACPRCGGQLPQWVGELVDPEQPSGQDNGAHIETEVLE